MQRQFLIFCLTLATCLGTISLADDAGTDTVRAAVFDDDNNLIRPGMLHGHTAIQMPHPWFAVN